MKDKKRLNRFFLSLILVLAFIFRFYGINWDQGHHLHPDERMITMVAERIHLPKPLTLKAFLSPESPLNPKFFAYGSLPIYLLKIAGNLFSFFNPVWGHYQGLNLVGRLLSVIFDLGTIILIFKISKILTSRSPDNLIPALFYALSVLAIQTAHFYVVDVPLTFFITLTLYLLIKMLSEPSYKLSALTGIAFGLALVSKLSALLLIIPLLVALTLIFLQKKSLQSVICYLLSVICFSFLVFSFSMPYALIDFPTFKAHTLEQSRMTKDAFAFPYTLQYVGTKPYFYQLKNMILWGMGVPLGVIAVVGAVFVSLSVLIPSLRPTPGESKPTPGVGLRLTIQPFSHLTILFSFFWPYFLITGSFAVKFMRYWLPIYPLFCIFAGVFIFQIATFFQKQRTKNKEQRTEGQFKTQLLPKFYLLSVICYLLSIFIWPLAFASIYSRPHTRVAASKWIYENIPDGSTLAVEHWDDRLPLPLDTIDKKQHVLEFVHLELPLYEPDTEEKWHHIINKLDQTNYIIIASNRLYTPLMKLTDCQKLPEGRCYPKTAEYYKKLFNGQLGFTKVAEFTSYPKFSIFNFQFSIRDDVADESFTVYDHPKVMIFKKEVDNINNLGRNTGF